MEKKNTANWMGSHIQSHSAVSRAFARAFKDSGGTLLMLAGSLLFLNPLHAQPHLPKPPKPAPVPPRIEAAPSGVPPKINRKDDKVSSSIQINSAESPAKITPAQPKTLNPSFSTKSPALLRMRSVIAKVRKKQTTLDIAWDAGELSSEDVIFALDKMILRWSVIEDHRDEGLLRDLAGLLVRRAPDKVTTPDALPPRVAFWIGDYYRTQKDSRATAFLSRGKILLSPSKALNGQPLTSLQQAQLKRLLADMNLLDAPKAQATTIAYLRKKVGADLRLPDYWRDDLPHWMLGRHYGQLGQSPNPLIQYKLVLEDLLIAQELLGAADEVQQRQGVLAAILSDKRVVPRLKDTQLHIAIMEAYILPHLDKAGWLAGEGIFIDDLLFRAAGIYEQGGDFKKSAVMFRAVINLSSRINVADQARIRLAQNLARQEQYAEAIYWIDNIQLPAIKSAVKYLKTEFQKKSGEKVVTEKVVTEKVVTEKATPPATTGETPGPFAPS